jgi:hypothetical protein
MKTVSSGAQVIGGNPTLTAASSIANSPLNFEGPLTKRLLMTFPTGMLLQSNVCIATAHVSFGLELVMSSRARRTAAMMVAHIATVLAYRALCSFSQATCRYISPIAEV